MSTRRSRYGSVTHELPHLSKNSLAATIALFLFIPLSALACAGAPAAESKAPAAERRVEKPDVDHHVAELKKRLPSSEFTIIVQPPFVVIGDEAPDVVKRRT